MVTSISGWDTVYWKRMVDSHYWLKHLSRIIYRFMMICYLMSTTFASFLVVMSYILDFIPYTSAIFLITKQFSVILIHYMNMFFLNLFGLRKIYVYGENIDLLFSQTSNNIFIANHQCTSDTHLVSILCYHTNQLTNTKPIYKASLKYVPIGGAALVLCESIDVTRKNRQRDISYMKSCIEKIIQKGDKFSYILFPEGTRYKRHDTKKIASSIEFCNKYGIEPFQNLLAPHVNGLKVYSSSFTILGNSLIMLS